MDLIMYCLIFIKTLFLFCAPIFVNVEYLQPLLRVLIYYVFASAFNGQPEIWTKFVYYGAI